VAADGFVSEPEQARRRFDRELVVDRDAAARFREAEAVLMADPANRAF
jgi:hypothetical protein